MSLNKNKLKEITEKHLQKYKKNLEQRFIEQSLDHCKRMIEYLENLNDNNELDTYEIKIIKFIYILDYARENIGPFFSKNFFNDKLFSDMNLEKHFDQWNFENLKNKISYIIDNEIFNYIDYKHNNKQKTIARIHFFWVKLSLDKKMRIKKRKNITIQSKRDYENLDSEIEKRRRKFIIDLMNHPLFDIKVDKNIEKIVVLCFAYTNICLNNCIHCMAKRHMSKIFSYNISVIESILKSASKHDIQCMLFTGGEPFLMLDEICYTIEKSNFPQIFITTSGNFAVESKCNDKTYNAINKIRESFIKNKSKNKYGIFIQISFDNFHQEILMNKSGVLIENSSLFKIANLIEIIFKQFPDINIALTSVRSGVKYNLLKYLLMELERRDIYVKDKDETLELYSQMVGNAPEKGPELVRMKVTFKFAGETREVFIGAQLLTKIGTAELLFPWQARDSAYDLDDFLKMREPDKLASESNMILIEGDGNVYLGGSLAGKWALGNLADENLDDILKRTIFDPLVLLINNNFGELIRWVDEVNPDLIKKLSDHPTAMEILNKILSDSLVRYYLTKRYIIEKETYPQKLKKDIGLEDSVKELKEKLHYL